MVRAGEPAGAVAGVILAAGLSRRMGQGKLLLPWQGRPILRHVVDAALGSQLAHRIVVTGARAGDLTAVLQGLPLDLVHNPDYASGLATSLRTGIRAVPEQASAALVMLGDQPRLTPDIIDRLIDAYRQDRALIVAPFAGGRRGNPVLFARSLFPSLLQAEGDTGARAVVEAHQTEVLGVEVDAAVFEDIDTPEAYTTLVSRP